MARWLHQTPLSRKGVPREAYQLAATYQLGVPIRQYSGIPANVLLGFSGIVAILDGLFLTMRLGSPPVLFYNCNQSSVLASSPILAICNIGGSKHEYLGGYRYAYWLGVVVALIFLVLGLILIARTIKELSRRSRTYQCTEGFVVIEGASKVITALLWDQITSLHQGSTMRVGFRTVSFTQTCFAIGKDGIWHEIAYIDLRKRIEQRLAQQS